MAKWIMVVDDDMANLQTAGTILSKNNMRVTALKSGQALLNYVTQHGAPDLILLDIMMPEMDGFETLKNLRRLETEKGLGETPVIFLTADEKTGTESKGFEVGVSDFIRKPFNPEVLLRRIDNVISMQHEMNSLKTEASIDKLTGFLNKAASNTKLTQVCLLGVGTLMMIDLDSFKLVNDIYGHEMGDKVLISFANIIRETLPAGSTYGRIGGDEFVGFAFGTQTEEEVAELTKQLNEKLVASAKEMMGEDMSIPLGTSVGAIFVPKHGNDYTTLLKQADKCLYIVKKNGKHGYSVFSTNLMEDMDEDSVDLDIKGITEIVSERNITNVALQLDMEAFTQVYRFANRYFVRNNINSCKVLFTLKKPEGMEDVAFRDYCDEFGSHICDSLRKSDLVTRNRTNQYYAVITDIREEFVDKVINSIIDTWKQNRKGTPEITFEKEFIRNEGSFTSEKLSAVIAVVDDDEMVLTSAKNALTEFGVRVETFLDGESFMKYVDEVERVPDLILLDVKMPGMDGFAVMSAIQEIGGDIGRVPVIFLTADTNDGTEQKGLNMGALDFIKKPIISEVLRVRVNHILELSILRKRYRGKQDV